MSAETLRKAAERLRGLVKACEPWEGDEDNAPWADEFNPAAHEREHGYHSPDVAYIATMHPGVGLALADWLDRAADWNAPRPLAECALAVARLILGGTS